jgi:hypothetical protein
LIDTIISPFLSPALIAGFAGITVAQNGAVYVETTTGNTFLSIDCSFRAEQ